MSNKHETQERHRNVFYLLQLIAKNPCGYFFYDDVYCQEIDCDAPNCQAHQGSVLDVEYHSDTNLCYLGATINVGSIQDFVIKLDTRTGILSASNSKDVFRVPYDSEQLQAVDNMYADLYAVLMRR